MEPDAALGGGLDDEDWQAAEPIDLSAEVKRLAEMQPLEYEKVRKAEAESLGIARVTVLDGQVEKARRARSNGVSSSDVGGTAVAFPEIVPWDESVNGADLLGEIAATFTRYMVLPPGAADTLAVWTLHTHAHNATDISPILAATSPTPECGKTTLLTILGALVPKPLPASNITTAALFRAVEKWGPTLLIDEADSFLGDNEEMRGVLNSGHNRAGAFVVRLVGDNHEPRQFTTWAPKAIAIIGKMPATLDSRSVHIELRRKRLGENVQPVRADRLHHLEPLRRKAARWSADNMDALRQIDPKIPPTLSSRRADNWRPLLAIAEMAGGDWPERAWNAAEALNSRDAVEAIGIFALTDTRMIFTEHNVERISSTNLAAALAELENRPWPEFSKGKEITTAGLARLLAPFKITPSKWRDGSETVRGYEASAFGDAWSRYLPEASPMQTATPPQTNKTGAFVDFASATIPEDVADEFSLDAAENSHCGGVALGGTRDRE